jgi:hypothetical protein
MVWLAMNEALSWAALGNARETTEAIQHAEQAWGHVEPDDMDELGGIATFTRPRQLYYAADALAWLPSEAAEAERYSAQAVSVYSDPARPEWAFGDQAPIWRSRVVCGANWRGAAEALTPVLDLPPEQRINGIVHSVQRVHKALVQAPAAQVSQDIQEQIEFFTHSPLKALPR